MRQVWSIGLVPLSAIVLVACKPSERKEAAPATATAIAIASPSVTATATATATATEVAAETTPPDDCTLERAAIKGKLDTAAPAVRKVIASSTFDAERRQITETVELATGVKATYSMGGCHHVSYGYSWELPAIEATDVRSYVTLARKLLGQTPLLSKEDILDSTLAQVEAAEPKQSGNDGWSLPCGDAHCELMVTRTGATMKISLSYDFAM